MKEVFKYQVWINGHPWWCVGIYSTEEEASIYLY
jgi:hypothetical protein